MTPYQISRPVTAICSLQPAALAPHVVARLCIIADPDVSVRYKEDPELWMHHKAAISRGRLGPVTLTPHMGALVAIFQDSDVSVRNEAVRAIDRVEQTNLIASHPDIITGIRKDSIFV